MTKAAAADTVVCESCGRPIPGGEEAFVLEGQPACAACYRSSSPARPPRAAAAPARADGFAWNAARWFKAGFFITLGVIAAQLVLAAAVGVVMLVIALIGFIVAARTAGPAPSPTPPPVAARVVADPSKSLTFAGRSSGSAVDVKISNTSGRTIVDISAEILAPGDPDYRQVISIDRVDAGDSVSRELPLPRTGRVDFRFRVLNAKFERT